MALPSERARRIRASATLELAARAGELRASGQAVLNLTAGEPDLPTPAPVVEAAHRALEQGHFHYTATPGVPALREAIAHCYRERLGIELGPGHVVVSNGAKQALYNAIATATDPGDRVGVLQPYWVSYVEQARMLGCEVVPIACDPGRGYRPDLDQLQRELERGLAVLVLNSPCNPTGASFGRADLEPLLELVAAHGTALVSDEIYEDIVYTDEGHVSPLHLRPDLAPRTCVVTGLSKAFAMTGWRVGFSIAPPEWSQRMSALQGHTTSNINAIAQQAAIAAFGHRELVTGMVEVFARRRELVQGRLAAIDGLRVAPIEGTFYAYLDASPWLGEGKLATSVDALAARLLNEHLLALVPGSAFGDDRSLRLSFAAPDATLREATDRLAQALR